MSTITQLRSGIERELADLDRQIEDDRAAIQAMLDNASAQHRNALTMAEDAKADQIFRSIERSRAARARKAAALAEAQTLASIFRACDVAA